LAGAVSAGIKKRDRKDLALIFSEVPACAAGVFTRNRVPAAPVLLDRERIARGRAQAVVANSGNANACTGKRGLQDAENTTRLAAQALGVDETLVLALSTGVIGVPLNMDAIETAVPKLAGGLRPDGFFEVAEAIMTTDTFAKIVSRRAEADGKAFSVTAVAKGAGMIRPDMATMLCVVCTDMGGPAGPLQRALTDAVAKSFNTITVDGDTSTNDTVLVLANGLSGLSLEGPGCASAFQQVLDEMLMSLALQIVEDAEGATKSVKISVRGAQNREDARAVAYAVAESPLVKTALYGQDANWGRIMAAVGRSGAAVDAEAVDVFFDNVRVVARGQGLGPEAEEMASNVLKQKQFCIVIDLGVGRAGFVVHTCDLSIDYVKINADYRT